MNDSELASKIAIAAVVVTYKRPDVRRCVESLEAQTRAPDWIVVIDNGRQARSVLRGARAELIETRANLGPAGGFALGFETALWLGADKIWAVDDDCEAEPDCLQRLANASIHVAVPAQVKPSGERSFHPSWNGPLFDSEVIRTIGLPRTELFYWVEDSEFFVRARAAGFKIENVPDAVVLNRNARRRQRGDARDWRVYYEVRNTLEWRLRLQPKTARNMRRAARTVMGKAAAIVFFEPHKVRSLRLWYAGVRDFRARRFGRVVEPD